MSEDLTGYLMCNFTDKTVELSKSSSFSANSKYILLYMSIAERVAKMSHCQRLKVGCIIVKDGRIVSMGWNGMPRGMDNTCELDDGSGNEVTREEVLHAEANALMKLALQGDSSKDADLYVTHAPCIHCAKLIHQAGIRSVTYGQGYRSHKGLDFLSGLGTYIRHFIEEEIENE